MTASPTSINTLLVQAAELLDRAAQEIRDAPLKPTSKNVRHIAEALTQIFEVQLQVQALHPELAPEYLNEPSKNPARALQLTLERARQFEALGEPDTAVAFLRQFITRNGGSDQCAVAEREILRIEGRGA